MRPISKSTINSDFDLYSDVAAEYYDAVAHPTCANFRTASRSLLAELEVFDNISGKKIIELGAGRSLTAEMLMERGCRLDQLLITDKFEEMLRHSEIFETFGAKLRVLDACSSNLEFERFDLIVAVLADPYNTPALWQNLLRLSSKDGLIALTFPSFDWMRSYRVLREHVEKDYSIFRTRSGDLLNLPSFIWPARQVIEYGHSVGLQLLRHCTFRLAQLITGSISPKLLAPSDNQLTIVEGYLFQKKT
jgi:hypothetical protein